MKKKGLIWAVAYLVLGLLIAIGPQTIFKVCKSGGDMVMPCFYTARAEIVVGAVIAVLGIALYFLRSGLAKVITGILILISSIAAFLIPTVIIGVCDSPHMHCNAVTRPALIVLSSLTFIIAAVNTVINVKEAGRNVKESEDHSESGVEESEKETL